MNNQQQDCPNALAKNIFLGTMGALGLYVVAVIAFVL